MRIKNLISIAVVLAFTTTACGQSIDSLVDRAVDEIAEQVQEQAGTAVSDLVEDAQEQVGTAVDDLVDEANQQVDSTFGGLLEDGEVLRRALEWTNVPVKYGMFDDDPSNDYHRYYKADCSGFVSFVWELDAPGIGTNQFISGGYAVELATLEEMQAGDVLNNNLPGENGHVVLFLSWIPGSNYTQFYGADLSGTKGEAVLQTFTLTPDPSGTGWEIVERQAPGSYFPQRKASN